MWKPKIIIWGPTPLLPRLYSKTGSHAEYGAHQSIRCTMNSRLLSLPPQHSMQPLRTEMEAPLPVQVLVLPVEVAVVNMDVRGRGTAHLATACCIAGFQACALIIMSRGQKYAANKR